MKRKQAVGIIIMSGFLLGGAWACGSAEEKGQVSAENSTDAQEDAGIGWLDLENYKERMSEKRVSISDAREAMPKRSSRFGIRNMRIFPFPTRNSRYFRNVRRFPCCGSRRWL